jgi:hypothetical protein
MDPWNECKYVYVCGRAYVYMYVCKISVTWPFFQHTVLRNQFIIHTSEDKYHTYKYQTLNCSTMSTVYWNQIILLSDVLENNWAPLCS